MTRFTTESGPLEAAIDTLVIAGWSGRDADAVAHHIAELQEIGVPPPSRTPLYYRVGADLLTTADAVQVVGGDTSGEAEAVLVATPDGTFVGLGSDHTDRGAETVSVALAKQACPKPVAPALWRHDEVADHWDELILRSWAWIDGARVPYQEGALAGLMSAEALLADHGQLSPGTAMFCGTMPVMGGIRPASRFEMALEDPVRGRTLTHAYDIVTLPVVA